MLEAAAQIRHADWNLAQRFTNMYMGTGGQFFGSGLAQVNINNPQGVEPLKMMNTLTEYMNPDYRPMTAMRHQPNEKPAMSPRVWPKQRPRLRT